MHRPPVSALQLGLLALGLLALLPTCGGPEPVPPGFPSITVELVDRRAEPPRRPLTLLPSPAPDFKTRDQSAWRVIPLLGEAYDGTPARLEILLSADGQSSTHVIDAFQDTQDAVWVLRHNRKGLVVLDQIDPADPFPTRHGRGGNRGRSGASIRGVTGLRLVLDAPAPAQTGDPAPTLQLLVDGQPRSISLEALAGMETLSFVADGGKGTRNGWSLRTLAAHVVGASARVTSLEAQGDEKLAITPEAWADVDRVPVLRLNRRGLFKFNWMDAQLRPVAGGELRNVSKLLISTR